MTLDDIKELDRRRGVYMDLETATSSRTLARHYRRKANGLRLRALVARKELADRPQAPAAMRMTMDPPSARLVPVSGPVTVPVPAPPALEEQKRANREKVLRQVIDAFKRGDFDMCQDLADRYNELSRGLS